MSQSLARRRLALLLLLALPLSQSLAAEPLAAGILVGAGVEASESFDAADASDPCGDAVARPVAQADAAGARGRTTGSACAPAGRLLATRCAPRAPPSV